MQLSMSIVTCPSFCCPTIDSGIYLLSLSLIPISLFFCKSQHPYEPCVYGCTKLIFQSLPDGRVRYQDHMQFLLSLPESLVRELFHEARSLTLAYHPFFLEIGAANSEMELNLCNHAVEELYLLENLGVLTLPTWKSLPCKCIQPSKPQWMYYLHRKTDFLKQASNNYDMVSYLHYRFCEQLVLGSNAAEASKERCDLPAPAESRRALHFGVRYCFIFSNRDNRTSPSTFASTPGTKKLCLVICCSFVFEVPFRTCIKRW